MKILMNGLIILMIVSVLFAGCIQEKIPGEQSSNKTRAINYIENRQPLITKGDFPNFDLIQHIYFVTSDNLTVSLYTESSHRSFIVNGSEDIPEGFRVYGSSETYNSSQGYLLLQYKVFDDNERLNDSMNMTIVDYVRSGFVPKVLNGSKYTQRIFVLESTVENINKRALEDINNKINATNETDVTNITRIKNIAKNMTLSDKDKNVNMTYILFGYGTLIGRIGVKDSKDKSLNQSLKILDIVLERLRVGTKNVTMNTSMFGSTENASNMINISNKNNAER